MVSMLCAIIFGYVSLRRNDHQDKRGDGARNAMVLTEIGYIKSGIDDIKRKQEMQEQQHIEVIARLTKVESGTQQAHKRIDRIEESVK